MKTATTLAPRVYVASLSDYNAGILHGEWFEADQPAEDLYAAVARMLANSPGDDVAEEYAIHDYDDFGPIRLGEYTPLDVTAGLARGLAEHGVAFGYWADHVGLDDWKRAIATFSDAYCGHWDSLRDWGEDTLDSFGIDLTKCVPKLLLDYVTIDVERFAADIASEYVVVCNHSNGIFVFEDE